jgi:phosphoenolpyruvate carboxykinase (ATP)
MVRAALDGELDDVETIEEPHFGFAIPKHIEGVPQDVLNPRNTWEDKEAYDTQAAKLVSMFIENFKQFEDGASTEIREAGPKL